MFIIAFLEQRGAVRGSPRAEDLAGMEACGYPTLASFCACRLLLGGGCLVTAWTNQRRRFCQTKRGVGLDVLPGRRSKTLQVSLE